MTEKGPWSTLIFDTPFLRAQTILQTQDINPSLRFKPMKGLFNCFSRIYMEEGASYLWRTGVLCFVKAALNSVFQGICSLYPLQTEIIIETHKIEYPPFDQTQSDNSDQIGENQQRREPEDKIIEREVIHQNFSSDSPDNPFSFAGLPISGLIIGWNFLFHPLEVIRVRYACDYGGKIGSRYSGIIDTARHLGKSEGIKAFYKGFIPMTLAFLLNKNMLLYINQHEKLKEYSVPAWFCLDFLLYPFIVTSHRMMMQPDNPIVRYQGVKDCVMRTYKDYGVYGFYRGYQVNLLLYSVPFIVFTLMATQVPTEP